MQGKIVKGIAGFYYVRVAETGVLIKEYECKARGIFRKEGIKPLVGDTVEIESSGTVSDGGYPEGVLTRILPRKNELIRPAVANIDAALIVMACRTPDPNPGLLDRFLISMERAGIPAAIVLNKTDLAEEGQVGDMKRRYAAYPVFPVSAGNGSGIAELREFMQGKTVTMAGPSGVGKSSLTNCLQSDIVMETGAVSEKIDRGRHTTRHSQLIALGDDTYLCDTPGFSSFYITDLPAEELQRYYPEFKPYLGQCYYEDCAHIHETDCRVREALECGEIPQERYDSYRDLYTEIRQGRIRR